MSRGPERTVARWRSARYGPQRFQLAPRTRSGTRPFVAHSPLMSWAYGPLSARGFSAVLDVVEVAVALPPAPVRTSLAARRFPGSFGPTSAHPTIEEEEFMNAAEGFDGRRRAKRKGRR